MKNLIVFNKPYGVICQFSPHEKHQTLKSFIPLPHFYPAGRLDTDSEGLLLLTNDGKLQNMIASPKCKVEKTYWVQVEGTPDSEKIQQLQQPLNLGDFITQSAKVRVLDAQETAQLWQRNPPIRERKTVPDFWLEIKIREGKNRQVRRMTAKVGYPCLRLIRVRIGRIDLFEQALPLGEWKFAEQIP